MVRADTNQARVNKCLIALTSKKIVRKVANPVGVIISPIMYFTEYEKGGVTYVWQGLP